MISPLQYLALINPPPNRSRPGQMMLAGMGLLNTMPMLATIMVEKGLLASIGEVLQVFVTGGPMYFMFHIQTRAHYFYQTLLAGGAQYRATGRGFVTHHSCFDDLYRFFANSHFYLGFEVRCSVPSPPCLIPRYPPPTPTPTPVRTLRPGQAMADASSFLSPRASPSALVFLHLAGRRPIAGPRLGADAAGGIDGATYTARPLPSPWISSCCLCSSLS